MQTQGRLMRNSRNNQRAVTAAVVVMTMKRIIQLKA